MIAALFAFGFENKKVAGVNVRIGLTTKHPENNDLCDKLVAVFRRLTRNPSYDTSAKALVFFFIRLPKPRGQTWDLSLFGLLPL